MAEPMRVLSLGAGVQSSTVLLMSLRGELPPLAAAIFADTQWEPAAVYRQLSWLEGKAAAQGVPVYRVTAGDLRAAALKRVSDAAGPAARVPGFVAGGRGREGMLPRECTRDYKVRPIRRQIRCLLGPKLRPGAVEQWFGISVDEAHRMREPDVRWITHRYPLCFDVPLTRAGCLRWLTERGYPEPPRSACVGCPYHADHEWRRLRQVEGEWADAVAFDAAIRHAKGTTGAVYLHRSLVPLPEVDLSTAEERGQLSLFGNECAGLCGV